MLFLFVGFSDTQHLKLALVGGSVNHRGFLDIFYVFYVPFHEIEGGDGMDLLNKRALL